MPKLMVKKSDGSEIDVLPTVECFEKITQLMRDDSQARVIYDGYAYPWLCGLCPRSLLRMLFWKETQCAPENCLSLIERLNDENSDLS